MPRKGEAAGTAAGTPVEGGWIVWPLIPFSYNTIVDTGGVAPGPQLAKAAVAADSCAVRVIGSPSVRGAATPRTRTSAATRINGHANHLPASRATSAITASPIWPLWPTWLLAIRNERRPITVDDPSCVPR